MKWGKRILAFLIVSSQISVGVTTTGQRRAVKVLAVWDHDVGENGGTQKEGGECRKDLSKGRGGSSAVKKLSGSCEESEEPERKREGTGAGGGLRRAASAFLPMLT